MGPLSLLCCLALTIASCWAQYTLQQDYLEGGNFLDQFTFWDTADPTDGFVTYLDQADAESAGLVNASASQVILSVDDTQTTTTGRQSVRLTSKQSYDSGLIILDLAHMPGAICGTWPAFWTVGPDWPNQGEIDIIEGVNDNTVNAMTLHTNAGCTIDDSTANVDVFSGTVSTNNCDTYATDQSSNAGCSIDATASDTYGTGFNNAGGGVYAMELTATSISVFFFSRDSIPADVQSGSPDPSSWGIPVANFAGDCDFATKFTNQQIVFDITFCGQWAGAVWPGSTCAAQFGSSCETYVGQNPSAFAESYWAINSLKVYSSTGSSGTDPSASSAATSALQTTQSTAVGATSVATTEVVSTPGVTTIPFSFRPPPSKSSASAASSAPESITTEIVTSITSVQAGTSSASPGISSPASESSAAATSSPHHRITTEIVTSITSVQAGTSLGPSAASISVSEPSPESSLATSIASAHPTSVVTTPITTQAPTTILTTSLAAPTSNPSTVPGATQPTTANTSSDSPARTSSPPAYTFPGGGSQPTYRYHRGSSGYPFFHNPGHYNGGGGGGDGFQEKDAVATKTVSASQDAPRETGGARSLQERSTSHDHHNDVYEVEMPAVFRRQRHLRHHRHQHDFGKH